MLVSDFSFTFLGTGTSAGVPIIACDCSVCTSDNPKNNRLRCSACVKYKDSGGQDRVVLIDTSPDLRQQVLREGITRCDAILFTHNHVDHTFGLDEVRRFNMVMDHPIDIYAERNTLNHLSCVFKHVFDSKNNVNNSFVAELIPNEIHPGQPINLFGVLFTPIRLMHGRLPIVGFRIDIPDCTQPLTSTLPLAYCTDVSSIPPESWPYLESVQNLALDMLRFRHHPTHLNCDQATEVAIRTNAKNTWFIHMTHDVEHEKLSLELPIGIQLAYDGLSL